MAVYPSGNPGVAPPDPNTPVGQFRASYSDMQYEEYDPAVPGFGNYQKFSDSAIEAFLALGNGSVLRAIGYALLQKANTAAEESESVRDYDLSIDLTKKAADLREQAAEYFALADQQDSAGEDAFTVVQVGRRCGKCPPELAGHYACQHCGWRW